MNTNIKILGTEMNIIAFVVYAIFTLGLGIMLLLEVGVLIGTIIILSMYSVGATLMICIVIGVQEQNEEYERIRKEKKIKKKGKGGKYECK